MFFALVKFLRVRFWLYAMPLFCILAASALQTAAKQRPTVFFLSEGQDTVPSLLTKLPMSKISDIMSVPVRQLSVLVRQQSLRQQSLLAKVPLVTALSVIQKHPLVIQEHALRTDSQTLPAVNSLANSVPASSPDTRQLSPVQTPSKKGVKTISIAAISSALRLDNNLPETLRRKPRVINPEGRLERRFLIALPVHKPKRSQRQLSYIASVCERLEIEANQHNLPPAFFARLIWTESRFNAYAYSPKGARGIAQFIPATARRRGLKNPYEVKEALRASASFLSDLRGEFGNIGLAAAAYNAGEGRIRKWVRGQGGLPRETRNYVAKITGFSAFSWKEDKAKKLTQRLRLHARFPFQKACRRKRIASLRARVPTVRRPAHVQTAVYHGGKISSRRLKRNTLKRNRAKKDTLKSGKTKKPKLKTYRIVMRKRTPVRKRRQPWGVQLAENFSRHQALKIYQKVRKRYASLLRGFSPMVLHRRNARFGRRKRYKIVMGTPTRAGAIKLCQTLRRSGGPCLVVKN